MGQLQAGVAGEPLSTKTLEQEQAVLRENSTPHAEYLCSHIGLFMLLWELEFSALTPHFDLGSSRNHILGTFFQGGKKTLHPLFV